MKINDNLCMKAVFVALLCLLALPVSALAADYYVKTPANGGSDTNPGSSWVEAKATIQAAMDLATSTGDKVHVAAGTYNERVSFLEVSYIELLGGYPAAGGTQAPWTNPTIIDGTGLTGSLVYIPGNFSTSYGYRGLVIDGFTIQNGTKDAYYGTGIESWSVDLSIKRCIIQDNTSTGGYVGGIFVGALLNESPARTLKVEECIIRNNIGPGIGGLVVDSMGYPTVELTNNLIYGNSATATGSPWTLYTCGGVAIGTGAQDLYSATFTNCTIADNTSAHGTTPVGGLAVNLDYHLDAVQVKNCIFWHPGIDDIYSYAIPGNVNISYSDIEDSGDTGTGVIHTDPAFAGASDYHLTSGSGDCIDGGTSIGAPSTDLEGTARPQGNGYDMGAYEYVAQATYGDELAVDFGGNGLWHYDGSTWTQLNGQSPDAMEAWNGGLAGDFGASGLWNYDGSSWNLLTTLNPQSMEAWDSSLAVYFAGNGLWSYDGSTWSLLTTNTAQTMQAWTGGIAVDFGSFGLWNYDGSLWSLLTTSNASGMESWSNGLAVDFGTFGLWSYNGSSWSLLTTSNAETMQSWTGGLATDFGSFGLWNYNGSSWNLLTTSNASGMADWNGGVAVNFSSGLWSYDGSSWSLLTTTHPEDMEGWATSLAADLGTSGLWSYDGSAWNLLTTWNAEDMVDVDLY